MSDLVEVKNQVATPVSLIEQAINKGVDVEQLSKLMDLQERWEAKKAKEEFYLALSAFQQDCPTIYKTKRAHNSSYTPLGDIEEQIKDVLAKHGLSKRFEQNHEKGIEVTCIITHKSGHSESTKMIAPADATTGKNAIQAVASTVTYLTRYTLLSALGITTADIDMDGRLPVRSETSLNPEQVISLINAATSGEEEMKNVWASFTKQEKESFGKELPKRIKEVVVDGTA